MNASQLRRYLAKRGCRFEEGKRHTIVLGSLKMVVYRAMRERGWRKADLARAMALNPRQIDRLLDLRHSSTITARAGDAGLGTISGEPVYKLGWRRLRRAPSDFIRWRRDRPYHPRWT